ncbi:LOW QUALITY PROTEIN: hypothetical protein HID58_007325, partial [Brassica napus]
MASKKQIKTAIVSNEQAIPINNLKPVHTAKMVHAKVLHSWKQNIQLGGETMEFVLVDENMCLVKFWIVVMSKPFSVLGRKKLEFILRDINDSRIPCCIWGNLTDILHSACNQDDGMVTLLLRFAKLGKFRGELQISNSFDASRMIINPEIPEAEAFKDIDNGDDTTLITFESNEESQEDNNKQVNHPGKRGQRDKWLIFPSKTIQEMIAFWLHLMVKDDTGVSKIMILDKVANGIVPESPLKLLNGSWDEGSVYFTDSQELNDSVTTPSSKRKEDDSISLPDISSTSKKPCLMTVKIEKAEEAAKKHYYPHHPKNEEVPPGSHSLLSSQQRKRKRRADNNESENTQPCGEASNNITSVPLRKAFTRVLNDISNIPTNLRSSTVSIGTNPANDSGNVKDQNALAKRLKSNSYKFMFLNDPMLCLWKQHNQAIKLLNSVGGSNNNKATLKRKRSTSIDVTEHTPSSYSSKKKCSKPGVLADITNTLPSMLGTPSTSGSCISKISTKGKGKVVAEDNKLKSNTRTKRCRKTLEQQFDGCVVDYSSCEDDEDQAFQYDYEEESELYKEQVYDCSSEESDTSNNETINCNPISKDSDANQRSPDVLSKEGKQEINTQRTSSCAKMVKRTSSSAQMMKPTSSRKSR